jgi:CRP/FNR family nitrogen fixation transcriptional regulator
LPAFETEVNKMQMQASFRAATNAPGRETVSDLLTAMRPVAVTFYHADALIYADGDKTGPLYVVEFGTVRICRMTADGRRQISAFHTAGDVFGFAAGDEHDSYAESVDGAGVRVLRTCCGNKPTDTMLMLALKSLARAQNHLMVLGRRTANERFAALLLDLMDRQGDQTAVHLPMQRNDIADYLGITFETVSRIIRSLKDQGAIRLRAINDIEILDADAIQNMCS